MAVEPSLGATVAAPMEISDFHEPIRQQTNTQHLKYFSWEYDFAAQGVDSLAHRWHWKSTLYAYPPNFLLSRIMQKIIQERVYDVILITPLFPLQSWWPVLMEMLIELPLILPMRPAITRDPAGHPTYWHNWPMLAWRIS
jgi:hypothetical protein